MSIFHSRSLQAFSFLAWLLEPWLAGWLGLEWSSWHITITTGSSSGTGAGLGQTVSHQGFMLWWEQQLAWVWSLLVIGLCVTSTDVWEHALDGPVFV